MNTEISVIPPSALPAVSRDQTKARPIVETFLAGRTPRTLEAYRQDLEDFARFTGAASAEDALRHFLAQGKGEAEVVAHSYRAALLERGLSPSTVNRRLAALRSVVKLSRLLGLADFFLEVPSVKSQPYRDTRGPGRDGVRRLLAHLARRAINPRLRMKATRDRTIIRVLYDLALRRGEATALDLEDVNIEAGTISILAKGRTEKEALTLPEPTKTALVEWLAVRGTEPGPLFLNVDCARKGKRLTGRSVAQMLAKLGARVGVPVRPHGLRHAAITDALDGTNGNIRVVQRFSRHRNVQTVTRYDDNRRDLAAQVARLVAERLDSELISGSRDSLSVG